MTPVIFHAALVDQGWPRCRQSCLCPQCHHNAVTWEHFHAASARRGRKCSVTSFCWPSLMLPVNGQRGRQELGQAQSQRDEGEGTWQKPQPLLSPCQKQAENGSRNQGGQEAMPGDGSVANHSNLQAAQPRRACICAGCVALHTRSVAVLFSWDND